jgi:molybdopterin/thiamine biosynthesis adenylyltransferase
MLTCATITVYTHAYKCRDLLPVPPNPGDVPSCAEGGVLGILPGVVGCIQATEVIKVLLDKGSVLSGRLLVYDAVSVLHCFTAITVAILVVVAALSVSGAEQLQNSGCDKR